MSQQEQFAQGVAAYLHQTVQMARSLEVLVSAAQAVSLVADVLKRVTATDPDLAPELDKCVEHVEGLQAAMNQMMTFVQTRYEVTEERFRNL